jgi:hypothetical protein
MKLEDKAMKLEDKDWDILLPRIKKGDCTPFLGAAVNHGILPLGGEIAEDWAANSEYDYPLYNKNHLAEVAQFLAIQYDPITPKELMLKKLDQSEGSFNPNDDAEPLNVLAKLPFPLYITTYYYYNVTFLARDGIPFSNRRKGGEDAGESSWHYRDQCDTPTAGPDPTGDCGVGGGIGA